ncbi:MAG: adenine phosphoribosyltransferase [Tissierellia bacterium]|jgi:adenine phosphoribosyltransferase|nr:adenine phosphoribosyltransferase [Tissierellia bacterium]
MNLIDTIRVVEDYPKAGISFKDITTLLQDPQAFRQAIDSLVELAAQYEFDYVLAAEARGFVLGTPIAYLLNKGFVPVRKPGKLPAEVFHYEYELEYGIDALEIHRDAIKPGDKVLIVDDLLATGGTSSAMIKMAEALGAEVAACLYLIELNFLPGRDVLAGYEVHSVVKYED